MINDVLSDTDERMSKTISALRTDFTSIRTGRASPALVDRLLVDYYGTPTPLQQIASINVPEAQMLVIRPYAANDIAAIEKTIISSDLGMSPSNDGQQIRLSIPSLTEERRRDLTKQVSRRAEEARVAVRNIRRDSITMLRDFQKEGEISEDEQRSAQERVQEKTDEYVKQVDETAREKETEIMTL